MARLLFLLMLIPAIASADTLKVETWLTSWHPVDWPLFADSSDVNVLLDADVIPWESFRPSVGEPIPISRHSSRIWEHVAGDAEWLRPSYGSKLNVGYAAVYVNATFDQQVRTHASCSQPFVFYIDGKEISRTVKRDETGMYRMEEDASLVHGKSLLLVKALLWPDSVPAMYMVPPMERLSLSVETNKGIVRFTEDSRYTLAHYKDFTLFDNVSSPAYSSNGKYLAYVRSSYNHTTKRESWLEVLDAKSNSPVFTLRPVKGLGHVDWLPSKTTTLFYTTEGKDGDDLWLVDFPSKRPRCVKRDLKGLVKVVGGSSHPILYFTTDEEADESEHDWKLWDELEDRMDDWTRRRALFALNFLTGETKRITATADSFALDDFAVSPTEAQILFTRRVPQLGRPYYQTEFWLYDTVKGTARKLLTQLLSFETRPLSLTWLDGEHVAYITAAYETLPDDTLDRNSTQTAVWLLNTVTGESKPLNLGVNYSVDEDEDRGALRWNPREKMLWMRVVRGCNIQLMRLNPSAAAPKAKRIPLSCAVVGDFDISRDGRCLLIASDPLHPNALIEYDASTNREYIHVDPSREAIEQCELPSWERWDFTSSRGDVIEGFLYYPPEYKPELSRSWPLIVYYYGGVSPRDLRFRYTYLWWAANGYMVYVLNPSGTVGYTPEFADRHSNDWGTITSQDILEGVDKLLAAKPFLDKDRVGAYGGSYGGFLTLDLATKTDRFAALASLSGISNIASYFGGGTWGFTYGDIALPRSFPWNRRDVFVEKSPVFHADQVKTPLLLTHGIADVNVPVGESDQMFVALKLLGKDVAYVQFAGEDHIFAKFENRVAEMEILREWFDKYLKNEPEAWEARWRK